MKRRNVKDPISEEKEEVMEGLLPGCKLTLSFDSE